VGSRVSSRLGRAVASTLESDRTLPSGRYRLRYHPPLGSVGGREVSPPNCSI
jgi:hypothetical protein